MKYLTKFIILLFILLVFPLNSVFAGGGRIVIQNLGGTGVYVGEHVNLTFKVYHAGSNNEAISTNERLEFRIENPREGDHCQTNSQRSNEQGEISGYCTAEQPGNYLMYVYSLDKNDESSRVYVYFSSPPTSTPTPIPPTFTPSPTLIPTLAPISEISTPTDTPIQIDNQNGISPTQAPVSVQSISGNKTIALILTGFLLVILFIYYLVGRKLFKLSNTNDKRSDNINDLKKQVWD